MYINEPIGKWIAILYKHHDQFVDDLLEKYGLNHSEGNLLVSLYKDKDGVSQKILQEHLGVDKATVSRSISSLIEKKYLKKIVSPLDGRVNLIFLTDKAKNMKAKILDVYHEWFNIFLDDIGKKDADKVVSTIGKMYEMIKDN